eukprot:749597-Hanusia_phi.AAC.7
MEDRERGKRAEEELGWGERGGLTSSFSWARSSAELSCCHRTATWRSCCKDESGMKSPHLSRMSDSLAENIKLACFARLGPTRRLKLFRLEQSRRRGKNLP